MEFSFRSDDDIDDSKGGRQLRDRKQQGHGGLRFPYSVADARDSNTSDETMWFNCRKNDKTKKVKTVGPQKTLGEGNGTVKC